MWLLVVEGYKQAVHTCCVCAYSGLWFTFSIDLFNWPDKHQCSSDWGYWGCSSKWISYWLTYKPHAISGLLKIVFSLLFILAMLQTQSCFQTCQWQKKFISHTCSTSYMKLFFFLNNIQYNKYFRHSTNYK